MVTSFLRHPRAENKRDQTVAAYRYAAVGLSQFLAERGMPTKAEGIRREHVETYIRHLLDHRSPATANQRFRSLQQFFKWLVEEGEIRDNPMAHMRPPTIPEQPVPVVADEDLRKLLATCDSSLEGRRDEALLSACSSTPALAWPRSPASDWTQKKGRTSTWTAACSE